jgi:hypothetical protein
VRDDHVRPSEDSDDVVQQREKTRLVTEAQDHGA